MGASLKGNLLPEGANSFLYEQFLKVWKPFLHFPQVSSLDCHYFFTNVRILRNSATPMKYNIGLAALLQQGIPEPVFYGDLV